MIITKRCTKCGNVLPITQFRKQSSTKDGLQYACIPCMDKKNKDRYSQKREEIIKKNSEYQKENRDAHNKANKKYYSSVLFNINKNLNNRLDDLLGAERESFLHLIGTSCSSLVIHLTGLLPDGFTIEDYGVKWDIQFILPPKIEDIKDTETQRNSFNWQNLTIRKINGDILDLRVT